MLIKCTIFLTIKSKIQTTSNAPIHEIDSSYLFNLESTPIHGEHRSPNDMVEGEHSTPSDAYIQGEQMNQVVINFMERRMVI